MPDVLVEKRSSDITFIQLFRRNGVLLSLTLGCWEAIYSCGKHLDLALLYRLHLALIIQTDIAIAIAIVCSLNLIV